MLQPAKSQNHHFLKLTGLFALIVLIIVSCSKKESAEPIVAQVGNRTISLTSFKRDYLPVILYGDKFDSPETRKQTLDYLIGNKLLAQEAEKDRLDTLSIVSHVKRVAERKAMARHLFDAWVRSRIPAPTEAELREAFDRTHKTLFVRHLFARTKTQADSLYALLQSGTLSFEKLAGQTFTDTTLANNGGALGWLNWGDLDENLENAAYAAQIGKFTKPVQSQYGWHILRVDDWKKQAIETEDEYQLAKSKLENRIYERREAMVGKEVLNDYMQQQNVQFNRSVAGPVFEAIRVRRPRPDESPRERTQHPEQQYGTLKEELTPYLDQTLVTFAGEGWTVREFLQRLPEMDRRRFYGNLYIGTAYLIRDELLGREGYAKGYDKLQDVKAEVRDRQDELLARLYLQTLWDTLRFNDRMIDAYYQKNWRRHYTNPDSLHLQEILVKDKRLADTLMFRLREGADFDALARKYTRRSGQRGKAGDLGWQAGGKTGFDPLYQPALKVKTGVPVGPIGTTAGWSIVKVIERRRYPKPLDEIRDKVKTDMNNYRQAVVRTEALKKIRLEYKIDRHEELLDKIDAE